MANENQRLHDRHRKFLVGQAAIAPDLAAAHVTTVTDRKQLNGIGFRPVPGMMFSWRRLDGREFHQYRPDKPGKDRPKYVTATRSGTALLIPDGHHGKITDPSVPLLVVEGTKQHLAAASVDLGTPVAVAGILGCWGWRDRGRGVSPDLDATPIEDRDIYVIFDADVGAKAEVWAAAATLSDYLTDNGAHVRWVRLEPHAAKPDDGLDDILARSDDPADLLACLLTDASDDLPVIENKEERQRAERLYKGDFGDLSIRVQNRMRRRYRFVRAVDDSRVYAIPRSGRAAQGLDVDLVLRNLGGSLPPTTAVVAAAASAETVLSAADWPVQPLALRSAVLDNGRTVVVDLAQPDNSRCVQVDAHGWRILDNPPDDLVFRRTADTRPLPDPQPATTPDELRTLLGWKDDDFKDRWHLVRGWLAVAFLSDIPRPVLGFVGAAGASKTTCAKFVTGLVDPPGESFGGALRKSEDDFHSRAMAAYVPKFDNLGTKISPELSDTMARLVTGASESKRRLYTEYQVSSVEYRRTAVYTAVAMPYWYTDVAQRVITVTLSPSDLNRRSERSLAAQYGQARGRMFGAVLDDLATVLARLPETRADESLERPRMADYFEALHALDPEIAASYVEHMDESLVEAAEGDAFVTSIVRWLRRTEGHEFIGTSAEALDAASHHRGDDDDSYWPKDPTRFAAAISRDMGKLSALGFGKKRVSKKHRQDRYWLRAVAEKGGPATETEDVQGDAKGDAGDAEKPQRNPQRHPVRPPQTPGTSPQGDAGDANSHLIGQETDNASEKPPWDPSREEPSNSSVTSVTSVTQTGTYRVPRGDVQGDAEGDASQNQRHPGPVSVTIPTPDSELAADFETGSVDDLYSPPDPRYVRLMAWHGDHSHGVTSDHDIMRRILTEASRLYWYNGAGFDVVAAARHLGVDVATKSVDVDGLDRAVRPQETKTSLGLDATARHYLGQGKRPDLGDLVTEFGGYDKIPVTDPRYLAYAARDAEVTWQLKRHLEAQVAPGYVEVEAAVTAITAGLNARGIAVDIDAARVLVKEHDDARAVLDEQFADLGLPTSAAPWATKAAAQFVKDHDPHRDWPTTDTGKPRTTRDVLATMAVVATGDDLARFAQVSLEAFRLRDTFPRQVLEHVHGDGRIYPKFRADSVNGRWSSAKPNVLGVGKRSAELLRERDLLLAPSGTVLIAADLKAIDNRAVAGLSGDAAYLEAVEGDLHSKVSAALRIPRSRAKMVNHGSNYGLQARSLAKRIEVSIDEAQRILDGYDRTFPGVAQWKRAVRAAAEAGQLLDNGHGRSILAKTGDEFTSAPARVGASCARDLLVLGLMRDPELWPRIWMLVHDEVILAVPPTEAADYAARLTSALTFNWPSPSGLAVPIAPDEWDGATGVRWSDLYRDED